MSANLSPETASVRESPAPDPESRLAARRARENRASCGGCDQTWTGYGRAHCSVCHRLFAGPGLFDAHRREVKGQGTCVDPSTIGQRFDPERDTWCGPEMDADQRARAWSR